MLFREFRESSTTNSHAMPLSMLVSKPGSVAQHLVEIMLCATTITAPQRILHVKQSGSLVMGCRRHSSTRLPTVAEGGCGKTIASTLHDSGTRADHAEDDAVSRPLKQLGICIRPGPWERSFIVINC